MPACSTLQTVYTDPPIHPFSSNRTAHVSMPSAGYTRYKHRVHCHPRLRASYCEPSGHHDLHVLGDNAQHHIARPAPMPNKKWMA